MGKELQACVCSAGSATPGYLSSRPPRSPPTLSTPATSPSLPTNCSSRVVKVALPASAALLVLHLARGEGLGTAEAAAYLAAVGGLGTECWKVVRAFVGGESG